MQFKQLKPAATFSQRKLVSSRHIVRLHMPIGAAKGRAVVVGARRQFTTQFTRSNTDTTSDMRV